MGEKFAYIYRGGGDLADFGCFGMAQRPYLLQYDLSGGDGTGIVVSLFAVSADDRPEQMQRLQALFTPL